MMRMAMILRQAPYIEKVGPPNGSAKRRRFLKPKTKAAGETPPPLDPFLA
jgi:hypothetical protein